MASNNPWLCLAELAISPNIERVSHCTKTLTTFTNQSVLGSKYFTGIDAKKSQLGVSYIVFHIVTSSKSKFILVVSASKKGDVEGWSPFFSSTMDPSLLLQDVKYKKSVVLGQMLTAFMDGVEQNNDKLLRNDICTECGFKLAELLPMVDPTGPWIWTEPPDTKGALDPCCITQGKHPTLVAPNWDENTSMYCTMDDIRAMAPSLLLHQVRALDLKVIIANGAEEAAAKTKWVQSDPATFTSKIGTVIKGNVGATGGCVVLLGVPP